MTKPRVFIGSSVEGLNVAYPVQQNLLHVAEVTVWDQGVFELSRTTMESLTTALSDNDFAVFVFSPDDLLCIRDKTTTAVRDNVLFEFGLFIGKLGRERVFFILPSGEELHLPTDLLGVTAGKYELARSDNSMQAATGPVCHQIRQQIQKLGMVPGRVAVEEDTGGGVSDDINKRDWLFDFIDKKYQQAKIALQEEIASLSGEELLQKKAWLLYCDLKLKNDGNISQLIDLATENFNSSDLQSLVGSILRFEGYGNKALELLSAVQVSRPKDSKIALAIALCHTDATDSDSAINALQFIGSDEFPDVAIRLAEIFESDDRKSDALLAIQRCYARHPDNRELRFKYARLAHELGQDSIAVYLFDRLTYDDSGSVEYWGYLGNSCLSLDLYDMALYAYRRAEKLIKVDSGSQWISANIGNLLTNKGLPTEACEYLERAVKYEQNSEYSHDRFATALRKKAAESKEFQNKCAEGKRQLRDAQSKAFLEKSTESDSSLSLLNVPQPTLALKSV
ncbi:DNA-binding protein [Pseudomonas alkylphenolica]|uniref:DNA-binding protein n=1 Tax=Pseudomonas alkylphenolica TaxID=237609 RepID=A0A6I6H6W1_9PSED|nr:TIR domain-containing protein [Pseudomonas alkylphenolica]QGW79886.1 DNA-binding protein [Pseudomonas alkylphenolica]